MPRDAGTNPNQALREAMLRQLRVDIGLLNKQATDAEITAIITHMVAADLDEITHDRLLQTIKAQTKTSIGAMRSMLRGALNQARANRAATHNAGLILDRLGDPLALEANAIVIIRRHLSGLFALDDFQQIPMVMRAPPWARPAESYPRPITDADDTALLAWVQRQGIHLRGRPAIKTVMAEIIRDQVFHPVRDYLDSLKWDGIPRLDRWLIDHLGAEDKPGFTTVVGPKWMISAVARIYQPGCIVKYCLLLLGIQDLGKSTALAILGGDWYTDDVEELGTKDAAMQNAGVWIVELAELASTRKAHIDAVKSFISRPIDRFRPPYGTHPVARPRQSVLAGTINPSDAFLKDETGNVRFWPVICTKIDLELLRRDRDQLWAEAVHRYRAGEHWWLEGDVTIDAALAEQAAHSATVEDHPWFSPIQKWLIDREKSGPDDAHLRKSDRSFVFTLDELLRDALFITSDRMVDPRITVDVGKILRKLGWKSGGVRLASFGGQDQPVRRWQKEPLPLMICNVRLTDGTRCPKLSPCPDHAGLGA